jgi:hypothetical protein
MMEFLAVPHLRCTAPLRFPLPGKEKKGGALHRVRDTSRYIQVSSGRLAPRMRSAASAIASTIWA